MTGSLQRLLLGSAALLTALASLSPATAATPHEDVLARVRQERPAVIETLREIVAIDSGSRDKPGLDRLAALLVQRLTTLGAKVERIPATTEVVKLEDTPAEIGDVVVGRFTGRGTRDLMLLAHMDTVYPTGTVAKMPFRIEGNLAYGPGIADDKAGVALILHALALLKSQGFDDYRRLTVVINGDEEISSPGSRKLIERLGAEHEFVLSCEPTPIRSDQVALATSGIASASIVVHGRSAHAGVSPELGRNALTELAHRLLQLGDLGDASGNQVQLDHRPGRHDAQRHPRPGHGAGRRPRPEARRLRRHRAQVPRSGEGAGPRPRHPVDSAFQRRRPPLEATDASRNVARQAQRIYAELDRKLVIEESGGGGGTDAAFAAVSRKPAVVESLGFAGANYHSNEAEYIDLESIVPRLYLLTRLITTLAGAR